MKNLPKKQFLELLFSKYQTDPGGFRSYLPEVAELLDALHPPRRSLKSPFGLTERERTHHQAALRRMLEKLEDGPIITEEAIRGLEHCATLIQDDSLPEEVGHETLVSLLKAGIGKSPGTFKSVRTVAVGDGGGRVVMSSVSLVRGVMINLDRNMSLVTVTITPRKVRERRQLLGFVGIGHDTAPDVALRHDDYLVEKEPHAAP